MLERADAHAQVKVIDFGYAVFSPPTERLTAFVGTAYSTAPEVFRRDYCAKCDMWSLGVIVYAMLSGNRPFQGTTPSSNNLHNNNNNNEEENNNNAEQSKYASMVQNIMQVSERNGCGRLHPLLNQPIQFFYCASLRFASLGAVRVRLAGVEQPELHRLGLCTKPLGDRRERAAERTRGAQPQVHSEGAQPGGGGGGQK